MPTPLIIQGTTVANIPQLFRAYSEVQPFGYREGATYTQILESLRVWILDDLVPYLNTNFSDVQDNWDENIQGIVEGINDALQAALDAIAESDVIVTDPAIVAAMNAVTSQSRTLFDGRYQPRNFPTTVDLTGATDATTALQAFFDALPVNSTVVIPGGSIINIASSVTIAKAGTRITGSGEIRYTGGATGNVLVINADRCTVDGLYMTNPSGAAKGAIYATANSFRATRNNVFGYKDGIRVAATGEFHDIVITDNIIGDIIGAGLGSGNNTANGENDGDGITVWGAAATITGNRVWCKAGKDARIGIHVENLGAQEIDTTYPHRDTMTTIVGNVVTGQFRRGIVNEGVAHTVIADNTIADATWWGIALIGLAHFSTVKGNTIKWTRTSADTQGSSATPNRSGIMLFTIQETLLGAIIQGNIVRAVAGSTISNGIVLVSDASVSSNAALGAKILDNQLIDESSTMGAGINFAASTTQTEIRGNRVPLFQTSGVILTQANKVAVKDNTLIGRGIFTGVRGVYLSGGATDAQVSGNNIEGAQTGIGTEFRSGLLQVIMNAIKTTTNGWDAFSSSTAVGTAFGNAFSGVTTKTANVPAGVVVTGANN